MSKRKLIAMAAAVALVVVGGVVWSLTNDSKGSDETDEVTAGEAVTGPDGNTVAPQSPPTAGDDAAGSSQAPEPPAIPNDSNADAPGGQSQEFRAPVRCAAGGEPTAAALPGDSARDGKKWVTVQRLSGSCDLSSGGFSLRGVDTRIAWRSDATSFVAFMVDPNDPDAAAGFADAECAGKCSEYQSITSKSGSYNLRVQADGGPWEVVVQEFR